MEGKVKAIVLIGLLCLFGTVLAIRFISAENPSSLKVTVYKSELYPDKNSPPEVIFEDSNGVEADLINNPNSVFGTGTVNSGVYKRIGLSVKNQITYSGPNPCGGGDITDAKVKLDASKGEDEIVELYFATADDGGDTGWVSNGSFDHPFLLQSPVEVKEDANTVVKIIFNTANTLQCIGNSPTLIPPTINVVNYIEEAPSSTCSFPADYWFVHYNISGPSKQELTNYTQGLPTLADIFQRTEVISGWGTVNIGSPDKSGVGVIRFKPGLKAEDGGFAEHRHNLSRYCHDPNCDEGLLNPVSPDPNETGILPYLLSGREIFIHPPEGEGAIQGVISKDCSLFMLVNIASQRDTDLILGVKKTSGFTHIPSGNYVILDSRFEIHYDSSDITSHIWSSAEMLALDISESEVKFMNWQRSIGFSPQYDYSVTPPTITWNINSFREQAEETTASSPDQLAAVTNDGVLISNSMEDFAAIGANNYFIFAGGKTDVNSWGNHSLEAGLGIDADESPSIGDLNGKWKIAAIESEGYRETATSRVRYGVSYGEVIINNGVVLSRSFVYKDFTGGLGYDTGSGETIELKDECYKIGVPVSDSSCGGPKRKVFYVYGKDASQAKKLVIKMVLDKNKNVILLWSPLDKNETPEDELDNGGSEYASVGVGVKVE